MSVAIELLSNLPFNKHLGLSVVRADASGGEVHMPDRTELQNHIQSQHAGALFTVGEAASGAAVLGAFGHKLAEMTPLAREASISYLKVARGAMVAKANVEGSPEEVLAELERAEKGVNVEVRVNISDASNAVCATVTVKWYLRKHV